MSDKPITREQALKALDDMDDYARMTLGVDAAGPRATLAAFIEQRGYTGLDPDMGFILEGANAGELAAYDYGCEGMMSALATILDGKDDGAGVSRERWEGLRRRVLALVQARDSAAVPADPEAEKWAHWCEVREQEMQGMGALAQFLFRLSGHDGERPPADLLALAKKCGATIYTNRHLPGEPAVAFGNESWARFCAAAK